ncbi:MAG TPA: hypothetical protein P5268_01120 [Candidatus Marinimicrobia bacterium]|nr:hypothetical protein [Candidatus Neomarinimicrobiota bacterium]HRS51147.1 hypothetical protein [Candidatus Neomarinimicrobiota bacterium]HRU91614.1 hypothetical protein [Candidatus Neomarinimicrobiota bacterium]
MKAYLAGAIEYAPDYGQVWRAEMEKFLQQEFGHTCYNPLVEEHKYLTPDESRSFRGYKDTDPLRFQQLVRKLIRGDLNALTNEIDYVIVNWDKYAVKGGGTYGEATYAFYHNIPVYLVSEFPIAAISGWIIGCTTKIFSSFDELKKYLKIIFG